MIRFGGCALVVLVCCTVVGRADELRAKVKKVDPQGGLITVMFVGAPGTPARPDQTFPLAKDVKITDQAGKELKGGFKAKFFEKPGGGVTLITERKEGKEVVIQVKAMVEAGG